MQVQVNIDKVDIFASRIDSESFIEAVLQPWEPDLTHWSDEQLEEWETLNAEAWNPDSASDSETVAGLISIIEGNIKPEYLVGHWKTTEYNCDLDSEISIAVWSEDNRDPYADAWVFYSDKWYRPRYSYDLASSGWYEQWLKVSIAVMPSKGYEILKDYSGYGDQMSALADDFGYSDICYSERHECHIAWSDEFQQPVRIFLDCYLGG